MPATQQDIADKVKVSRSLVAGVLSDHPTLRVSKETRRRILHAAKELEYRPNSVASNLRRGKTGVVTLVYRQDPGEVHGQEFGPAIAALASSVSRLEHEFQVRPFDTQESLCAGLREIALRSQCDAIILWVEHGGEAAAQLLESLKFPFIIKGRHESRHPSWFQADFDHEAMMSNAVKHLVSAGHSRIGYLGPDNVEDYSFYLRKGYTDAMNLLGLDPARWNRHVPEGVAVAQAVAEWLDAPDDRRPTAIAVGASNAAWVGIELALARRGRRLGLAAGDFAAIGGRHASDMLYGEAMAYNQVELSDIAESIAVLLRAGPAA